MSSDLVRVSLQDVPRKLRLRALVDARRDEKNPDGKADLMIAALLPSSRKYLVSREAVLHVLGRIPEND